MTVEPVSMTMPSVDCPTPYAPPHMKAMVMDRIKQRINNYERHGQKCAERYNVAQRTIRANQKRETAMLWQKFQEFKNKKGAKCKMDSRQKATSVDTADNDSGFQSLALSRVNQSLKRKMQMGNDPCEAPGYGDPSNNSQQEAKKMKNDLPSMSNGQRPEYPLPSVSVQIVQNFGSEPAKQIETTVNVHSNRNMPDSQSVSVNVGSKNIKQEMMNDGRQGQQQMNQQNMNPGMSGNTEANDLGGLLGEDFMNGTDDIDINMLYDIVQQMPDDMMDELNREFMTPDGQQMTSQSQMSMTSQSQMSMTSPSQMPMTSQSQMPMTSQSQQPMTSQYSQSQHRRLTPQSQQMTSPLQHMSPPGQHMTSPMTSQQMMQQQNARMMCKSEKVEMFHGFHGNTPENKPESRGLPQHPSHSMTQQNISANIVTQQSVRVGANNFSANLSSQQNISLNMSSAPQNNYPPNLRQMPTNNNNMTSQHIHRLNQVAQFVPHEPTPEPPRLFHPPASSHGPSQPGYYESHSQQLKQLAEKTRYGMNVPVPVNMTSDLRSSQPFPHYREGPPMTQQMNMQSHPMPSGSQRLSHMDANMYSRSSHFVQSQRSGTMNMMMQQSMQQEAMMMKQYQMQNNQHGYYNRVPEPHQQQVLPSNANISFPTNGAPLPSWNSRGAVWPSSNNPMHRPQITPEQMQRPQMNSELPAPNFLPELDQDLNILDEILSKSNA